MGAGAKLGSARGVARADKTAGLLPPRADGRDPRAVYARGALAMGDTRLAVAAKLGLSRKGLTDLIERDDPVRFCGEDGGHLVTFHLPDPPRFPSPRDPAHADAWAARDAFCDRLLGLAHAVSGPVAAGLRHLADLHRHHATFYPSMDIPASDCAAPTVIRAHKEADLYGSPGLAHPI